MAAPSLAVATAEEQSSSGPSRDDSQSEVRCPICLENVEDKAFTDPCFHLFCLTCILQWSEVASSCPMCKTKIESLIHDVKASNDYKIMSIKPKDPSQNQQVNIDEARRFMYRTTRHRHHRTRHVHQSRKPASDERRSVVYRAGLRALPISAEGSKIFRVRDITAAFFKANPAMTHRLLPWLTRDLRVVLGEEHVEFMMQLIMSLIDKIDMESDEFVTHLQPFLHDKTEHFIHELVCFATSPLDMIAYDAKVSYDFHQVRPVLPAAGTTSEAATEIPPAPPSPQPGPSSADNTTELQWRLFDEMVATSWDDSPLIRGSVREEDQSETEQEDSQAHSAVQSSEITSSSSGDRGRRHSVGKGKGRARDDAERTISSDMSPRSKTASRSERESGRASRMSSSSSRRQSHSEMTSEKTSGCSRRPSHSEIISERSSRSRDSPRHRLHSSSHRRRSSTHRHRSLSHTDSDSVSHRHKQQSRSPPSYKRHKHHKKHSRYSTSRSPSPARRKQKSRSYSHRSKSRSPSSRSHHRHRHHKKHTRHSNTPSPGTRRRHSRSSHDDQQEDLHSIPTHTLAQELEAVEKEIASAKQQLLHKRLNQERTALIQQSLHTERTGEERRPVTRSDDVDDEVTSELAAVERAILKEKQQLLKVMKRMVVKQTELDEDQY